MLIKKISILAFVLLPVFSFAGTTEQPTVAAVKYNNIKALEALKSEGKLNVNEYTTLCEAPLNIAAEKANEPLVNYLLANGASVMERGCYFDTVEDDPIDDKVKSAATSAVQGGDRNILKKILNSSDRAFLGGKYTWTYDHAAGYAKDFPTAQIITDYQLHHYGKFDENVLPFYLRHCAYALNTVPSEGIASLYLSASRKDMALVQSLEKLKSELLKDKGNAAHNATASLITEFVSQIKREKPELDLTKEITLKDKIKNAIKDVKGLF